MMQYYLKCTRTNIIYVFDNMQDAFDFSDSYITPPTLVAISLDEL